jgi:hypothetical protein
MYLALPTEWLSRRSNSLFDEVRDFPLSHSATNRTRNGHNTTPKTFANTFVIALVAVGATDDEHEPTETDSVDAHMEQWLAHPQLTAHAVRTATPPIIDGDVDDSVWEAAPVQSNFTQHDPDNGEPASEQTAFQILDDDEALGWLECRIQDSLPSAALRRTIGLQLGHQRLPLHLPAC